MAENVANPSQSSAVSQAGKTATQSSLPPTSEHFIPLTKTDLMATLADSTSLNELQREQLKQLGQLLEATIHHHYHDCLRILKDAYANFDPDSDTIILRPPDEDQRRQQAQRLFDQFGELLEKANYTRLSQDTLDQAIETAGHWGFNLDVDFEAFDRLEVFARGIAQKTFSRRRWFPWFQIEEIQSEVYQRLVVIFRFSQQAKRIEGTDADTVYIKVFKNIPKMDLDSLLPGSRVKMTLLDQSKIILPTASGVVLTIVKIVKAILLAGVLGTLALIGIICGTIGYGVKSFLGYVRTKEKHQLNLTRNLYFQNLDNNAGVLFRLLDEAEAQEFREAVLAYFVLWRHQPPEGWTELELDRAVEKHLAEQFGLDVDFEAPDAIEKLMKFRMIHVSDDDRLQAVSIEEALNRLDEAWDGFFPFSDQPKDHARAG